jgi:hypothetical protein
MTLPSIDTLKPLAEPFEILEIPTGKTVSLKILSWELGRARINPRDGRPAHEIHVLRVKVPRADKVAGADYWDITSKHFAAGMLGFLEGGGPAGRVFRVTWHGSGPSGRPSIEVAPATA